MAICAFEISTAPTLASLFPHSHSDCLLPVIIIIISRGIKAIAFQSTFHIPPSTSLIRDNSTIRIGYCDVLNELGVGVDTV